MTETMLWEYRVLSYGYALRSPKDEELQAVLNEWGAEGWEVISVEFPQGSTKAKIVARRPQSRNTRRQSSWPG